MRYSNISKEDLKKIWRVHIPGDVKNVSANASIFAGDLSNPKISTDEKLKIIWDALDPDRKKKYKDFSHFKDTMYGIYAEKTGTRVEKEINPRNESLIQVVMEELGFKLISEGDLNQNEKQYLTEILGYASKCKKCKQKNKPSCECGIDTKGNTKTTDTADISKLQTKSNISTKEIKESLILNEIGWQELPSAEKNKAFDHLKHAILQNNWSYTEYVISANESNIRPVNKVFYLKIKDDKNKVANENQTQNFWNKWFIDEFKYASKDNPKKFKGTFIKYEALNKNEKNYLIESVLLKKLKNEKNKIEEAIKNDNVSFNVVDGVLSFVNMKYKFMPQTRMIAKDLIKKGL